MVIWSTGTNGAVHKYNITSGTLTDITPVSGSELYFGFGGVAVDYLVPGTIMVAALNRRVPPFHELLLFLMLG